SSRRRHTRFSRDWSSDVCSSDLRAQARTGVDATHNIKLGDGGIREIEFIVQLTQLIRGGRMPSLQKRGLLAALKRQTTAGVMPRSEERRVGQECRARRAALAVQK